MHYNTQKLTPQQNNYIPAGKFIYTDETFLIDPPKYQEGEAFVCTYGQRTCPCPFFLRAS